MSSRVSRHLFGEERHVANATVYRLLINIGSWRLVLDGSFSLEFSGCRVPLMQFRHGDSLRLDFLENFTSRRRLLILSINDTVDNVISTLVNFASKVSDRPTDEIFSQIAGRLPQSDVVATLNFDIVIEMFEKGL